MKINTEHDLSAITECVIADINISLKSRKICNAKVDKKDKLFEHTKSIKTGVSIEIKNHHKKMSTDEFADILIDPIVAYMQKQIDKHVFEQIFKSSAKAYVSDDIFGTKYDVNIKDTILKEHYRARFENTNGISLDAAHEARLNDRIIKLQELTKNIDFDGVLLVDKLMTNNMKKSFKKIKSGIGIPFLKANVNDVLPPFWKGAIIGKDAIEFCSPPFYSFGSQFCPSYASSDSGISVRSTITFDSSTRKSFLHIDLIFECLVDKNKIMFLKEEECIIRN